MYYPTSASYNYADCGGLPFIIFVHGGAYSDCSSFEIDNTNGIGTMLIELARRGFVVFNVNYRTGRLLDRIPFSTQEFTSVQEQLAGYRAGQDVRGAIRSILKHQENGTFDDLYRIDPDKMFLAGNSAGAVAVLGAAYYPTQSMINQIFPKASGSSITMQQTLGNADIDYYYGDYQKDYFPNIKGILNLWGGVTLPRSVTSYSEAQAFFASNTYKPPVISFFGENDNVVWPEIEPKFFSPNTDDPLGGSISHLQYNTANNTYNECVDDNFQLNTVWSSWDVSRWGSYSFSKNILGPLSVPWERYQDCQMRHGLDDDDFDCPGGDCNFKSDFGTGYTDQKNVYLYIAQRAANFFQMILAGTVSSLSKKEFIECKNNRNSCSTANDYQNNCCTDCSSTTTGDKCNSNRN